MKDKPTVWSVLKVYINTKNKGDIITRQEMIKHVEASIGTGFSEATVDYCRNLLEKTGFISKSIVCGEFIVKSIIPDSMTTSQLRKEYDEDNSKKYKDYRIKQPKFYLDENCD